jgi:hypothetical protein
MAAVASHAVKIMALDRNSSSFLYPQFFDKPGRRNRLRGFNGVPVRGNEKIIL